MAVAGGHAYLALGGTEHGGAGIGVGGRVTVVGIEDVVVGRPVGEEVAADCKKIVVVVMCFGVAVAAADDPHAVVTTHATRGAGFRHSGQGIALGEAVTVVLCSTLTLALRLDEAIFASRGGASADAVDTIGAGSNFPD